MAAPLKTTLNTTPHIHSEAAVTANSKEGKGGGGGKFSNPHSLLSPSVGLERWTIPPPAN